MSTSINKGQRQEAAAVYVEIDKLTPWDRNPRHNDHAVDEVAASIRRFGFGAPIIARKADGMVIAGHTRLKAARKLGLDRVPVRFLDLDPTEAQLLAIADNKVGEIATWDEGALAAILRDLDVGEAIEGLGFDSEELDELLATSNEEASTSEGLSDTYTRKIVAPVYEPHGDKPEPRDLFDRTKTDHLVAEIRSADLPDDVREFLEVAAQRHTVLDFRSIAEFYAHADAPLQRLMERSALVVIDFEDAIANGFVRMTKQLAELATAKGDADA